MQWKHGTATRWTLTFGTVDRDGFCPLLLSSGFASRDVFEEATDELIERQLDGPLPRHLVRRSVDAFESVVRNQTKSQMCCHGRHQAKYGLDSSDENVLVRHAFLPPHATLPMRSVANSRIHRSE